MMVSTSAPVKAPEYTEVAPQACTFEDIEKKEFITKVNDKILRVSQDVFIYFLDGKPSILASCELATEQMLKQSIVGFMASSQTTECALLVKRWEKDQSITLHRHTLDGTSMNGKWETISSASDDLKALESQPLPEQLKKAGFNEMPYEKDSLTTLEDHVIHMRQMAKIAGPKRKAGFQEEVALPFAGEQVQKKQKAEPKSTTEHDRTYIEFSDSEESFELVTPAYDNNLTDSESVEESGPAEIAVPFPEKRLFIKEIKDQMPPRIFAVILRDQSISDIRTTLYQTDSRREIKEIKGEIIDVVLSRGLPKFTLQTESKQRSEVTFQWREGSNESYFTVFCEPVTTNSLR